VTPTWARYSIVIVNPTSVGQTFGTAGTDKSQIDLWLSTAPGNTQRSNIGVQAGTITIFGRQLEVGSVATPLELPDYEYDWANCQRYYQATNVISLGFAAAGTIINMSQAFNVTMRVAPTIVFTNQSGQVNMAGIVTGTSALSAATFGTTLGVFATGGYNLNLSYTISADI
jgi:hypothetical protein